MQRDYQGKRIAFVSTRIAGTDGVSLEIAKWAQVIERVGLDHNSSKRRQRKHTSLRRERGTLR